MTLPAGTLIAVRYEVRSYLGDGGYGEVYRVYDHHLDSEFALKLLKAPPVSGLWAEAQMLMNLRSKYILEVQNADTDRGVAFLVTHLATNGSAEKRVGSTGVAPATAMKWIQHACRGATRTHSAGLLHRDIKPDNLFLDASDGARLGDFGIAVKMDANGEGPPFGTPATTAPEVAQGGNTNVASDVYSLGATMYALLAGHYPNQAGNAPIRDLAPHVGIALAKQIHTAIDDDPNRRHTDPAALDSALGRISLADRYWYRTDEHPTHQACFRGDHKRKTAATVCLVAAGNRYEVVAVHQPSQRRIPNACRPAVPQSVVPRNLRAAMRDVA